MMLLASAALRSLALALAVGLGLMALRLKRPSLRLGAWTLVLATALAMPLLSGLLPPISWHPPLPSAAIGWPETTAAAGMVRPPLRFLPGESETFRLASAIAGNSPRPTTRGWVWLLGAIYFAGVVLLLLRALLGWRDVRRLRAAAQPIGDAATLARLRGQVGKRKPPVLAQAEALTVPLTVGVLQPAILLPAGWQLWGEEQLKAVLAHEAAHVLRRDTLRLWASLAHRALFWFSPLPWWLHTKLGELAEQASDEAALAAGVDPAHYAESLLRFMAALGGDGQRARWQALALARRVPSERRLEAILAWRRRGRQHPGLGAALLLCALPLAGLAATLRLAAGPMPVAAHALAALGPRAISPAPHSMLPPESAARVMPAAVVMDDNLAWMRVYASKSTSELLQDSQFNALLDAMVPKASFHLGVDRPLSAAVTTLLRGMPFPVTLRAGRYLSFSAASPSDRLALAWVWVDLENGSSLGAIVFNPSNGEPTPSLTFFTRQAGVATTPPPEALRDFDAWSAARLLPAPLTTYFISPGGEKSALVHAPANCRWTGGTEFGPQLCQALNMDQANADMAAGLFLLRQRFAAGATNPAAMAELDAGQQAWLGDLDRTCGMVPADGDCRVRRARARAQSLRATLDRLRDGRTVAQVSWK